jgi:hypothetical protein
MKPRCTIISKPINKAVHQRNNENYADVPVEILYTRPVHSIIVKAIRQDYSSEWISLDRFSSTASGTIRLPAGDWYTLNMKAMDENGDVVEEDTLDQVGVGEVFITCGQSNSLNFGETLTAANNSLVVSYNPQSKFWQPCVDPQPCENGPEVDMGNGGSIWPTVGDLLASELRMPIGFYATGWGGAALSEFGPGTIKYKRLFNALHTVGIKGVRAILWHQGETDAVFTPDSENYKNLLKDLINRSRQDAGWVMIWIVAQAAFHPKATKEGEALIRKAQVECCNQIDIIEGPNSDELQGDLRILNSAHFTLAGLLSHGRLWSESIGNLINSLNSIKT